MNRFLSSSGKTKTPSTLLAVSVLLATGLNTGASAQSILPAHPDAPGGGNPFQGLGRPDDPYPARYEDFLPKSDSPPDNADGLSESGLSDIQNKPPGEVIPKEEAVENPDGIIERSSENETGRRSSTRTAAKNSARPVSGEGLPLDESETNQEGSGPQGLPPDAEKLMQTDSGASAHSTEKTQDKFLPLQGKGSPKSREITERIRSVLTKHSTPERKPEKPSPRLELVPPPPATIPTTSQNQGETIERQALGLINKGEFAAAENKLKELVSSDRLNLHARYLLAVSQVHRKKYDEARSNYKLIIDKASDAKLKDLAEAGLRKLGH